MSKIVVVGANHAGTAAINTMLDNYSGNEVVVLERNFNMSFLKLLGRQKVIVRLSKTSKNTWRKSPVLQVYRLCLIREPQANIRD